MTYSSICYPADLTALNDFAVRIARLTHHGLMKMVGGLAIVDDDSSPWYLPTLLRAEVKQRLAALTDNADIALDRSR